MWGISIFYLKLLTDPVVLVLLFMAIGLSTLKGVMKQGGKRFGWWVLFACFALVYILSISPTVLSLAYITEKDYLRHNVDTASKIDVVVVLGGGIIKRGLQSEVGPSEETSSRLLYGLQVLKLSNAKFIVLSGGGSGKVTEADVMSQVVNIMGVDESKILIEANSSNTWEHSTELDKLLTNKDLTIGIVTSALHMKRSLLAFSRYFDNIVPLPSHYFYSPCGVSIKWFLPRSHNFYKTSTIIQEIMGVLWYSLRVS